MDETGSAAAFDRLGTLGIEEEYFVVDAVTGRPTSGTDELVYEYEPPEPLADRLDHELFKFVIETQTPTLSGVEEASDALDTMRSALASHANEHGFGIAAAGLHPLAKWREQDHATKDRYRAQLDRIGYPQHRNTTAGLHVHVGVDDADMAVWVANECRKHLPMLLALSANSPYWNGYDTGLASARAKIFEGLPNTGMPTAFDSYADYERFERYMVESRSIADRGELWFDVRPHSTHGTVEVRTPDAHANPDVVLAFVEYIHALVVDLAERYADGEGDSGSSESLRRELLDENKWRAMRHGHEATLLESPDDPEPIALGELVDRECSRLGLDGLRNVYDGRSGATRQRALFADDGVAALASSLRID